MPTDANSAVITLRPTPAQAIPSVVVTIVCAVLVNFVLEWWAPALIVIVGALALFRDYAGVRLTAEGVQVRTLLRAREVRWDQIRRIEAPGTRVQLSTPTSTVSLAAPRKGIIADPDFDTKLLTVRTRWQAATSPNA